jgi:hypothetical protein
VTAKLSSSSVPKATNLPIMDGELAVCIELARDLGLEVGRRVMLVVLLALLSDFLHCL